MDMLCMIESLDLIPQICGCVVVLNGFLTLSKWYVSIAHSVQRSPNDLDIPKRLLRLSKASSSTWRTVSMWHGCTKGKQLVLGRNLSMGIHALELIFLGGSGSLPTWPRFYGLPMKFQFSSGRDAYNILKWLMNIYELELNSSWVETWY